MAYSGTTERRLRSDAEPLFVSYYLGCLAHASYLVGEAGRAFVIDPQRDVDCYLEELATHGLELQGVLLTHNHADFVAGHVELAQRTTAPVFVAGGVGAAYDHRPVADGDELPLGDRFSFRAIATPGHTPHCTSWLLLDSGVPTRVFTGDTLFIEDIGRPDLLEGEGHLAEPQARQLYGSLQRLLALPDAVEVWPAHGAGSLCGKTLSGARHSTIERERAQNPPLQLDPDEFIAYAREGQPVPPRYFNEVVAINRAGSPPVAEALAGVERLAAAEAARRGAAGAVVVDGRPTAEFAASHAHGALNASLNGSFAPMLGSLLPLDTALLVVAPPDREAEALSRLLRVGFRNIALVDGGMHDWPTAELASITRLPAAGAAEVSDRLVDVSNSFEYSILHVPGAPSIPLAELGARAGEIGPGTVCYCGNGHKSMAAVSWLARNGIEAMDITGGLGAMLQEAEGLEL